MNKKVNNENGIALIMVIILLVAVGSLVSVLMSAEVFNISFTGREVNKTKAFYLAEAGVQRIDYLFNKHGSSIFEDDNSLTGEDNDFFNLKNETSLNNQNGFYKITDESKINNTVKLEILGEYNSARKKIGITIDLSSDLSLSDIVDDALFAAGDKNPNDPGITLNGSSNITGDVKTNISDYDLVQLSGSSSIDGDFALNYQGSPKNMGNIIQEKKPGDEEWNPDNSPYQGGEEVWYEGLYYKSENWAGSIKPGTDRVWQVVIPEDENWPWFEYQVYNEGDKVWYNGELYTAKYETQGSQPNNLIAWERQIPNVNGDIKYTEKVNYPEVQFPDFPDLSHKDSVETKGNKNGTISSDGYYEEITVKSNTDLIIDRNGNDRIIRVKDLDIKQGNVKFANPEGEGKLIIYVEDTINFGGSSTLGNWEQKENVIVHYAGTDSVDFAGNTKFYGSLNVKSADINLGGSNTVSGYIFSGGENINVSGAVSIPGENPENDEQGVLIYALNSNLELNGSGNLKGSAIVDNAELIGNTSIDYIKPNFEDYFFIEDILDFDNSGGGNSNGENDKIIWYNK